MDPKGSGRGAPACAPLHSLWFTPRPCGKESSTICSATHKRAWSRTFDMLLNVRLLRAESWFPTLSGRPTIYAGLEGCNWHPRRLAFFGECKLLHFAFVSFLLRWCFVVARMDPRECSMDGRRRGGCEEVVWHSFLHAIKHACQAFFVS